ncbi:MAG: aminodeoxychorismate/anthranilate synthase component II, partial [Flavobacteriales bacterium]|nr:aminodeoxychorismate/anthranilate synthase component II [Flavobacteriales bacterium]
MKVLVVDFYDSFTFNLVHYLEALDCNVTVIKHDFLELNTLTEFQAVLLSPGPGLPHEKDNLFMVLSFCDSTIPVFGICLGLQAIGMYLGGQLVNQEIVKHGVQEEITI